MSRKWWLVLLAIVLVLGVLAVVPDDGGEAHLFRVLRILARLVSAI